MTEEASGGLVLHARANLLVGKKMIAGNTNGRKLVTVARVDDIYHLDILPILRVVLAHSDGGLEVSESLQVVLDVAPAFVEQIIVDRAFFVDGHQSPQDVLVEFKTFGGDRLPPDRGPL